MMETLHVLIPFLVPALIAVIKQVITRIPRWVLPVLAPLLGAVPDILAHYAGIEGANITLALALGASGTGVREIVDQLKAKIPTQ